MVVGGSIGAGRIIGILGVDGVPACPGDEKEQTSVRAFIECATIGVVSLKEALGASRKAMLEGRHHTVIIRNSYACHAVNCAKAGIRARWNRRAGAFCLRQTAKTIGVGGSILNELVDTVISEIADAQ